MKIIPGILESNFEAILLCMDSVKPLTHIVQIDVCDGGYVTSHTWPYMANAVAFDMAVTELQKFKQAGLSVEYDLMIQNPENTLFNWLSLNPSHIWIHVESTENMDRCLALLHGYQIDHPKFTYGIAIMNTTPVEKYHKYLRMVYGVQIMGIKEIGKQGQEFDHATYGTVDTIRELEPEIPIQIDGGVSVGTIKQLKESGVDSVVCGSALFGVEDIEGAWNALRMQVE